MSDLRMRPRFRGTATRPPQDLLDHLSAALEATSEVSGVVYRKSAVIRIREEARHLWSPQLHVAVEEAESGSQVLGLFSPHPTVWSFFIALYLAIAFSGVMGVTYGYSQWILDRPAFALWAGPAAVALTLIVYVAARIGRHLGRDQMSTLSNYLRNTIDLSLDTPTA